ncbi:MAG: alpha/beta fold hydrolase [Anaerolineae bacterium]
MSAIILESSLVHYEALGRGKPLLFLHDWLGSWRYWVPTMLELSSSYRAYAIDFWGFGDSDKVKPRYSLAGYVGQVALFVNKMGIPRLPIIGHGLGGLVALHFAADFPHLVEQLMVVNTPLSGRQISRSLSAFEGGNNPASRILGRRLNAYEEVALEAEKTDGTAVAATVRPFLNEDLTILLEDLEMPVLLVYGRQGQIIEPPDDDVLDDLDYNAYAFIMEDCQHYPMLEETPKFNRLVLDFLIQKDNWDAIQVKQAWRRRMR